MLIDVFIMKFLVSYLGAVKIKLIGGSELWALRRQEIGTDLSVFALTWRLTCVILHK